MHASDEFNSTSKDQSIVSSGTYRQGRRLAPVDSGGSGGLGRPYGPAGGGLQTGGWYLHSRRDEGTKLGPQSANVRRDGPSQRLRAGRPGLCAGSSASTASVTGYSSPAPVRSRGLSTFYGLENPWGLLGCLLREPAKAAAQETCLGLLAASWSSRRDHFTV